MTEYQAAFDNLNVPSSRLDTAIEWLLIGLLAFMPLAFGVVHAWSEEVVIILAGAIVLCFLLKLILHHKQSLTWTWAYVPIGLFILVSILQLIPLPTWLVNIISSNTVAIKKELLSPPQGGPDADALLQSMTLSFYPIATAHDLRIILALAAVFVVVFNVFRRTEQLKRLLIAIAVIGSIVAAITLAHNLFGNGKIYWFIASENCRGYSGPFVNHSNYGQFMNLSIGAILAILLVKLRQTFAGKKLTPLFVFEYLSSKSAKSLWLLIVLMGLNAATVFICLTRGGIVSMLIAMAFTTLLFTLQRPFRSHSWIMVVMALIAFICVLYTGFDAVYDRLATLKDFHQVENGRMQLLKDITVTWTKFPIFGTGLGTHSVVHPMFDRSMITRLAVYAENEYAQAAEETGIVGLGILILFGIIVWSGYARSLRITSSPIHLAAYGLGFGILAILIHSITDFGQHLPANSFLSAIFCAILLRLSQQNKSILRKPNPLIPRAYKILVIIAVSAGISLVWIWAIAGADKARLAETQWKKALEIEKGLAKRNWQGSKAEYADLLSFTQNALDYQPHNVQYRYWLNVYRWRQITQTENPAIEEIANSEDIFSTAGDIVVDLRKAQIICPTYGPSYTVAGQIERNIFNDQSGSQKIRKGFLLAPSDPIACFVAGLLDVSEGKIEDCTKKFEKAVQLDSNLFNSVADIYINHLSRPHLAISLAGNNIGWLSYVAGALEDMQYADLAEQTRLEIRNLLEAMCSQPDATASAFASLADICNRQQSDEAAIENYHRALALDYGQVAWRLELAKLLARTQRIPEAIRQAKICLRLQPHLKDAQQLVADLSVHPAALGEETDSP
jgi:tetratricopeptide (TPR) repeat protein